MTEKCKEWLRAVLVTQFEQAVDYAQSREDLLEWCGHIDEVVNTLGLGPIWPDGSTAVQAAIAVADEKGSWS